MPVMVNIGNISYVLTAIVGAPYLILLIKKKLT